MKYGKIILKLNKNDFTWRLKSVIESWVKIELQILQLGATFER